MSNQGFKKRKADVDAKVLELGLDPTIEGHRKKACNALREDTQKKWFDGTTRLLTNESPSAFAPTPVLSPSPFAANSSSIPARVSSVRSSTVVPPGKDVAPPLTVSTAPSSILPALLVSYETPRSMSESSTTVSPTSVDSIEIDEINDALIDPRIL